MRPIMAGRSASATALRRQWHNPQPTVHERLRRQLPDPYDLIAKLQIRRFPGEPPLQHAGQLGGIRRAAQEHDQGLDRRTVAALKEGIIQMEVGNKVWITAGLEFQVKEPGRVGGDP